MTQHDQQMPKNATRRFWVVDDNESDQKTDRRNMPAPACQGRKAAVLKLPFAKVLGFDLGHCLVIFGHF